MSQLTAFLLALSVMLLPDLGAWAADRDGDGSQVAAVPGVRHLEPAPGRFLVAKRSLLDPNFRETVIYLVAHDEEGTWGMVVNRRTEMRLSEVLPDIEQDEASEHRVFVGGPVGLSHLVMLFKGAVGQGRVQSVNDDVYVSLDRGVLENLLDNHTPTDALRLFAGHAGWSPGQLEAEIAEDAWYVVPGDIEAVFSRNVVFLWHHMIAELEPDGIEVQKQPRSGKVSVASR
jgi:putative transcriptional regulator